MTRSFASFLLAFSVVCPLTAGATRTAGSTAVEQFGRTLFFDASLSGDGTVSCATCHKPDRAFSDGRRVALGIHQQAGTRNTPSLVALGKGPFFWDGRTATLDELVLQPFMNPVEMGLRNENDLVARVGQSAAEISAFHRAFPAASHPSPDVAEIRAALSAYVRSIPSGTDAYDRYVAGNAGALSANARRGLALFTTSGHCQECHQISDKPASFTDGAFHSTLINPQLAGKLPDAAIAFAKSPPAAGSLGPVIASNATVAELGRYVVTEDPHDIGSFRTPSLRNVAATAPYMHDGSAATLRDAVDREIYYRSLQRNEPNTLTEQDRRDLVAFLESLTASP